MKKNLVFAVAVVIEHGAMGSNSLAIASKVFEAYFYGSTLDDNSFPINTARTIENVVVRKLSA